MQFERLHFEQTGSTNDEAAQRARVGAPEGLIITARRQNAGRGRQGRVWQSPEGNLYASFLLRPRVPMHLAGQISLVGAVAVGATVGRFGVPYRLKWPNDVMARGAKLSGLLLESEQDWVVLGIGINVLHCPPVEGRVVTSIAEVLSAEERGLGDSHLPSLSIEGVLSVLQEELVRWYTIWQTEGLPPVRKEWLAHAMGIGARVRVTQAEGRILLGVMETMDADGALIVRDADGTPHRILSGDVLTL